MMFSFHDFDPDISKMGMGMPIYATERSRLLEKWAWALMWQRLLAPPPILDVLDFYRGVGLLFQFGDEFVHAVFGDGSIQVRRISHFPEPKSEPKVQTQCFCRYNSK